jgi:hypothetical protein
MPDDRVLEGAFSWVTFFGQAKKVTRPPGMAGEAQQGRTFGQREASKAKSPDSRFRGNDEKERRARWIPAFAGMTVRRSSSE